MGTLSTDFHSCARDLRSPTMKSFKHFNKYGGSVGHWGADASHRGFTVPTAREVLAGATETETDVTSLQTIA